MNGTEMYVVAIVTAMTALIGAITAWYSVISKIAEVHKIVNSQRTAMMDEIASLKEIILQSRIAELHTPGGTNVASTATSVRIPVPVSRPFDKTAF